MSEAEREEALELSKGVESDFLDVTLEEQRQQHATESEDTQVLRGADMEAGTKQQSEDKEDHQNEGQRVYNEVSEVLGEIIAPELLVERGVSDVFSLEVQ